MVRQNDERKRMVM